MKNLTLKILTAAVLCGFAILGFAQSDSSYIALKATYADGRILLRWSASDASTWAETNRCGFRIERYTIRKHGVILQQPHKTVIADALKAEPLSSWEEIAGRSSYAAIIAQALYGESFSVTSGGNNKNSIGSLVNLSRETEQRFLTSMYAAELDFKAACKAAWGFTDSSVTYGESYQYRIYPADTVLARNIQYGYAYVSTTAVEELPKPSYFTAKFADRCVMLKWYAHDLKTYYTAYVIQKSDDGRDFYNLSETPVMNMSGADFATYPDSLKENDKIFYYRLCGVDMFGRRGPWSDTVSGMGVPAFEAVPVITNTTIESDTSVTIKWRVEAAQETLISHFELNRSDSDRDGFSTAMGNISRNSRELTYNGLKPVNYFTITAVSANGERATSFPVLVQPVDSVPPAVPTGLKGYIDSTGVVRLHWRANSDSDIYGYRLFRTETKGGRLIRLNDLAVTDTVYTDSVNLKMLNKDVFYAVAALDHRYNQSEPCKALRLRKPDIIPPMAPVIAKYTATAQGVNLQWLCATPDDVSKYLINRHSEGNADTIVTVTDTVNSYTDIETSFGRTYTYYVTALDSSGNASPASPAVTVKAVTNREKPLSVKIEKEPTGGIWLLWKPKGNSVFKRFDVYKRDSSGNHILKVLSGEERSILDRKVSTGNEYTYFIKAYQTDGEIQYSSPMTLQY